MQALPPLLETVEVPDLFSPSAFASWGGCAAKLAIGSASHLNNIPGLAAGPRAAIGSLVHRVLERWARDPELISAGELFDVEYKNLSETLASDPIRQHFARLDQIDGLAGWTRLRAWVVQRCAAIPNGDRRKRAEFKTNSAGANPSTTGAEVGLASRSLRLRGRADRITRVGSNAFEVRDYKTGAVVDEDGLVKEDVAFQLRSYGLIVLERFPEATVRLVVDDGVDHEVAFEEADRMSALETIEGQLAHLPVAGTAPILKVAHPGSGCFGCRARHICPAYRDTAPRWWLNHPTGVDRIPNDTWGTIVDVVSGGDVTRVILEDAAGRRVRVDGLDRRHGLTLDQISRRIHLFELETSGPSKDFQGRRYSPRIFHEIGRDRRDRRAWNTQSFVEA